MRQIYRPFGRIQLFELHEQPWIPPFLRDALTEWLRVLWVQTDAIPAIARLIENTLKVSGATRIIDLCSGSSGPIGPVQKQLKQLGMSIPVLLTDRFPNLTAMQTIEHLTQGQVRGERNPIDASCLPPGLDGLRTLFNSFHHFCPDQARAILADAFRSRQPIGVFELTEPKVMNILLCFFASFVSVFVFIWTMEPKRPLWWVFTWIFPLIPLVIGWDALVSHLRSYTPSEMIQLTSELKAADYEWTIGSASAQNSSFDVGYLLGMPLVGQTERPRHSDVALQSGDPETDLGAQPL